MVFDRQIGTPARNSSLLLTRQSFLRSIFDYTRVLNLEIDYEESEETFERRLRKFDKKGTSVNPCLHVQRGIIGTYNQEEEGACYCCPGSRMYRRHVAAAHPPEEASLCLRRGCIQQRTTAISIPLIPFSLFHLFPPVLFLFHSVVEFLFGETRRYFAAGFNGSSTVRHSLKPE